MLDVLAALSDRLSTLAVLKLVSGAADFATAAESRPRILPAAYVLPLQEGAGSNALSAGGVAQLIAASYGVALAVANVSDATGRAALLDLKTVRDALSPALLGWTPGDDLAPFEFGGGSLLGFHNGVLWWQDVYSTEFIIKT